jgi:pyridoxamine 5'-phosphate oxidase
MSLPPIPPEVVERLRSLLARAAKEKSLREPTAFTLATADLSGRPSTRTVLLKSLDEHGFVFYTNLHSRKGQQLAANPQASLTMFWQPLYAQVHAEGITEPVADEEANAYWATRGRDSPLGAWASDQSRPLAGRAELLKRVAQAALRYPLGAVPRPPHWSGLRLKPDRIEFWQGADHRLHDRECWTVEDGAWMSRRLFP